MLNPEFSAPDSRQPDRLALIVLHFTKAAAELMSNALQPIQPPATGH
jgi:hypothetical protein